MKNSFNLEVLKTSKTLTTEQQRSFRIKLKPLLGQDGVISLCLEADELYIEFDSAFFNLSSFRDILKDVGFPLNHANSKQAS